MIRTSPLTLSARQTSLGTAEALLRTMGARLLGDGLPAHRIEESLVRIGRSVDVDVVGFGLPTAILVHCRRGREQALFVVKSSGGGVDLARLAALHAIVGRLERRSLCPIEAMRLASEIGDSPRGLRFPDVLGNVLVAVSSALLLGGRNLEIPSAALLALTVSALVEGGSHSAALSRIVPTFAPFVTMSLAAVLGWAGVVEHPLLVTVASLVALLPGMSMTTAVTELATGHWVSGAGRIAGGISQLGQLGFGLALGLALGRVRAIGALPPSPAAMTALPVAVPVLSVGLTLSLRVPTSARVFVAAATIGTYAVFAAFSAMGAPIVGIGLGALFGSLLAHRRASVTDTPTSVVLLPAISMLVPGLLSMVGVSAALLDDSVRAMRAVVELSFVLVAAATGMAVATALLPPRTEI